MAGNGLTRAQVAESLLQTIQKPRLCGKLHRKFKELGQRVSFRHSSVRSLEMIVRWLNNCEDWEWVDINQPRPYQSGNQEETN
jgi:hypothetical protein